MISRAINNIIETYKPFNGNVITKDDSIPDYKSDKAPYGVKVNFNQRSPLFVYFEDSDDRTYIRLVCETNKHGLQRSEHNDLTSKITAADIQMVVAKFVDRLELTIHP